MIVSQIHTLLEKAGLSQTELSRRTGLNRRTIWCLTHGLYSSLHISVLDRLCQVLETTPGELLQYRPSPRSEPAEIHERPVLGDPPPKPRTSHTGPPAKPYQKAVQAIKPPQKECETA